MHQNSIKFLEVCKLIIYCINEVLIENGVIRSSSSGNLGNEKDDLQLIAEKIKGLGEGLNNVNTPHKT